MFTTKEPQEVVNSKTDPDYKEWLDSPISSFSSEVSDGVQKLQLFSISFSFYMGL